MLISFFITWVVTTIAFIILTKLPTGIESDDFGRTGLAALIFGLLNGLTSWFLHNGVLNLLTLGLLGLVGNTILFGLTALAVKGFRLRWGLVSAVLGAIGISLITSILSFLISNILNIAV